MNKEYPVSTQNSEGTIAGAAHFIITLPTKANIVVLLKVLGHSSGSCRVVVAAAVMAVLC